MEARLVHGLRRDEAQPAHSLDTDGNSAQRRRPACDVALAGSEHRRNDDGARMHRTAFERIVEIFPMRRGAVDESSPGGAAECRVAEDGARSVLVPGGKAEPHYIDEQVLAHATRC
jgi:hypothetical protein